MLDTAMAPSGPRIRPVMRVISSRPSSPRGPVRSELVVESSSSLAMCVSHGM